VDKGLRNEDEELTAETQSIYRLDLLVENKVVLELKSVEEINDVHLAQVLTYLKLGNYRLGLLINFNVSTLKNGIKRVVNNLK
jgi:GxxExxY protein